MAEKMVAKQFNTWYPYMFDDLIKSGGSTYSYEGRKKSGIAVGGYSKNGHHVDAKDLKKLDRLWFIHHVRRVVEEYEHLLSQQNYYIGTYLDSDLNVLFIDIVKVFVDKDEAMLQATNNGQRCVYDLATGKYYKVPESDVCHDQLYNEMGC